MHKILDADTGQIIGRTTEPRLTRRIRRIFHPSVEENNGMVRELDPVLERSPEPAWWAERHTADTTMDERLTVEAGA
jgi:hypothetical protein